MTGAALLLVLLGGGGSMDARPPSPPVRARGDDPAPDLARLRALYLGAVADESAIEAGLREVERLRARLAGPGAERMAATLSAYEGALVTLRAKHAVWPPTRLHHLRSGLEVLDASVASHPGVAEIRYLRLMSCYYLPGILGRKWSVREDFAALARLLPGARSEYPAEAYRAIVDFVLQEGDPGPAERAALEEALPEGDE